MEYCLTVTRWHWGKKHKSLARTGNNIPMENNSELQKLHRWGPLAPWWAETSNWITRRGSSCNSKSATTGITVSSGLRSGCWTTSNRNNSCWEHQGRSLNMEGAGGKAGLGNTCTVGEYSLPIFRLTKWIFKYWKLLWVLSIYKYGKSTSYTTVCDRGLVSTFVRLFILALGILSLGV